MVLTVIDLIQQEMILLYAHLQSRLTESLENAVAHIDELEGSSKNKSSMAYF